MSLSSVMALLRDVDRKVSAPLTVVVNFGPINTRLDEIVALLGQVINLIGIPPTEATSARLVLSQGETDMSGTVTVDTANEVVSLEFVDDKGDVTAAPAGVVVTFSSDNTAVATVDATSGAVTPVSVGTVNLGATIANADGSAVLEADGTTPFPVPASVALTVDPGAAVGERLSLSV